MNRLGILVSLLLLAAGAACKVPVSAGKPSWERLEAGMWVEAEGRAVEGRPLATEIDEKEAREGDRPERYEITGPVEDYSSSRKVVRLLDHEVFIDAGTSYEDSDKNEVAPFQIESGSWFKVKIERKAAEKRRARVVRKVEAGERFEVEGQVSAVRADPPAVKIGEIWLDLEAGTDVGFLQKEKKRRAQEALEGRKSPLTLFQEDEQKGARFTIQPSDSLFIGGQVFMEARGRDEYDLNRDRDRDDTTFEEEIKGDVLWGLDDEGSFALFEVSARRKDDLNDEVENETEHSLQIPRAYAYWVLGERTRLQIGRQDFDEEREWLYDDVLDGIRLHYNGNPIDWEVSLSSGLKTLYDKNAQEDITTSIALARYILDDDHHLSAYVIDRRDRGDDDFSPIHYGLRSYGRPSRGLRHWLELSRATGDDGDRRIDGYGMDAGLTYVVDHDLRPAVTVGWALGTGDRHPDDARAPFRQTGLQDNNARFGGVTSFRFYGELFDPELSNLEVTTLGAGFRPVRNASIDLIAHTFRQDWKSDEKGVTDLKRAPNGRSRSLGWELDMVLGYRWERAVSLELVLAYFEPGNAFDKRDPAYLANIQVRYRF